jgi:hypothetical protein
LCERGRERAKRKLCSCVAARCVSIVILFILRLFVIIHEMKRNCAHDKKDENCFFAFYFVVFCAFCALGCTRIWGGWWGEKGEACVASGSTLLGKDVDLMVLAIFCR